MSSKSNRSESQTPRERAIHAYDSARRKAAGGIEDAPLLTLAGGLAAGAILAALLPVSRRERELVGPVAGRLKERASDAVEAAKDAGQARLDELGLTRDKGTETLRTILEGAGDAAKASAEAAVANLRGESGSR
jgi:hypothetical protein